MRLLVLCPAALCFAHPALACKCDRSLPVCQETAANNTVFIGTVESISPIFLNRWNLSQRPSLVQLNEANERYMANRTPPALSTLKDTFRKTFPDLSPEDHRRLDRAATHQELLALFSSVMDHGKRILFRVRTVFRNGDDDDDADDDDDDDDDAPETFEVWTPFGDCGVDFQQGETYLVFGNSDEETSVIQTDSCTRTRRLSDAGADLAYLYFFKDRKLPSSRLDGFTTSDPLYQTKPHDPDKIGSPVPGVMIELRSSTGSRYTTSDANGHFFFDGLDKGVHQLSAYAPGFPDTVKLLAGPKPFDTEKRSCASQVLLIR